MPVFSHTLCGKEAPVESEAYFDAITRKILTAIDAHFSLVEQEDSESFHACHAIVKEGVQQGFLILLAKELASIGKTAAFDTHVTNRAVALLEAMLGITDLAQDAIPTLDDFLRVTIQNYEMFLVKTAWHIRRAFVTTWRRKHRVEFPPYQDIR